MNLLLEKLGDEPRVAAFICYAIHEIARNIRESGGSQVDHQNPQIIHTSLDPFFPQIAMSLLQVAQKGDGVGEIMFYINLDIIFFLAM